MSNSVLCIATTQSMANTIITRLKSSDFSNNDISVLFPDKTGTHDFAHEASTKAPEGATAGAAAGGAVGGAVGLILGLGLLTVPGVGPFLAAGPIMAALSGIAVGGTLGGIGGALVGMGIPEIEAKRYEGKIHSGNILISVHARDSAEENTARHIFEHEKASDIATTGEAPTAKDATGNGMWGKSSTESARAAGVPYRRVS